MPPPGTPLMITSQHPLRIVIQTPKNDLGTAVGLDAEQLDELEYRVAGLLKNHGIKVKGDHMS